MSLLHTPWLALLPVLALLSPSYRAPPPLTAGTDQSSSPPKRSWREDMVAAQKHDENPGWSLQPHVEKMLKKVRIEEERPV